MRTKKKEPIKYLIYTSIPSRFDESSFNEILSTSQTNNSKDNITGALIYRPDLYIQFLEGPVDSVDQTYKRIEKDKRHGDIHKLAEATTDRRLFTSWAMRGDPLETWMWSHEDVQNGVIKKLNPEEAFSTFNKLSRDVDQFN